MSYLGISRSVFPQLKMDKEGWGEGGGAAGYHGHLRMTSLPVTKGFLSQVSTASGAFGTRHSLKMTDIPPGTSWRPGVRELHPESPASVAAEFPYTLEDCPSLKEDNNFANLLYLYLMPHVASSLCTRCRWEYETAQIFVNPMMHFSWGCHNPLFCSLPPSLSSLSVLSAPATFMVLSRYCAKRVALL